MTIKQLKQQLNKLGVEYDECEVICQKDSEGNGYSPLSCIDIDAIYIPDTTWHGEVYSTDWTADQCCMDEEEHKELMSRPRALILAPVN